MPKRKISERFVHHQKSNNWFELLSGEIIVCILQYLSGEDLNKICKIFSRLKAIAAQHLLIEVNSSKNATFWKLAKHVNLTAYFQCNSVRPQTKIFQNVAKWFSGAIISIDLRKNSTSPYIPLLETLIIHQPSFGTLSISAEAFVKIYGILSGLRIDHLLVGTSSEYCEPILSSVQINPIKVTHFIIDVLFFTINDPDFPPSTLQSVNKPKADSLLIICVDASINYQKLLSLSSNCKWQVVIDTRKTSDYTTETLETLFSDAKVYCVKLWYFKTTTIPNFINEQLISNYRNWCYEVHDYYSNITEISFFKSVI